MVRSEEEFLFSASGNEPDSNGGLWGWRGIKDGSGGSGIDSRDNDNSGLASNLGPQQFRSTSKLCTKFSYGFRDKWAFRSKRGGNVSEHQPDGRLVELRRVRGQRRERS